MCIRHAWRREDRTTAAVETGRSDRGAKNAGRRDRVGHERARPTCCRGDAEGMRGVIWLAPLVEVPSGETGALAPPVLRPTLWTHWEKNFLLVELRSGRTLRAT